MCPDKPSASGLVAICREGAIDIAPFDDLPGLARFDSEVVVHGDAQLLFAAKVSLSCLNRDVPEQELNLIQFTAREMA